MPFVFNIHVCSIAKFLFQPFTPPPHFRRWMKKFMRRWHNKNSPGCSHDDKDDSPDDQGEEGGSFGEDYLKNVGQSVASMLDPMG